MPNLGTFNEQMFIFRAILRAFKTTHEHISFTN